MHSLTETQFEKAKNLARKLRELISLRTALIAQGKLDPAVILPSIMWKQALDLTYYCFDPPYEIVDTWRLHTFAFTGRHLAHAIDNGHNPPPPDLIEEYSELTKGLPEKMIANPPAQCGEIGWKINKRIVNADVVMYQRHLTALFRSGVMDRLAKLSHPINILEIGAGYGALAYFLKSIFPQTSYYIIDLAEALIFSSVYLGVTLEHCVDVHSVYDGVDNSTLSAPRMHFMFLPNFLCEDLCGQVKCDLVINTGSFGEMTENQVSLYSDLVSKVLNSKGLLYEENQDTFIPVSNILNRRLKPQVIQGRKKLWSVR